MHRLRRSPPRDDRRPALPDPRCGGRALSPDALRGWFEDWLDACNRHDLAAVRDLLAPDVRRAGAPRGADAWLRDLDDLLTGFPDFRWKRVGLVVEDDRIAAHLRTRGTHRGVWQGVAPTGRRVSSADFAFCRVTGGRMVEYAGGSDPGLLEQLRG